MIHFLALLGVLGISFSAIFVRLALVSPVTAAFYRAAYAVPMLVLVRWAWRVADRRSARDRLLALASGLLLAIDLDLWHQSIAFIGAGLATVIANVQVIFVAVAAWLLYRERPGLGAIATMVTVLSGVVLTSGLGRHDAYGDNPALGVIFGVMAGGCYAAFLLVFRSSNRSLAPPAGPLLDSTIGTVVGAAALASFDPRFTLAPAWQAHAWLALLALVSQVAGWLLISTALPRLPALETSILLLAQPVWAMIWGLVWFDERLSVVQWAGAALVVAGVAGFSVRGAARR